MRTEDRFYPYTDFDESFALMAMIVLMSEADAMVVTSTSNIGRMARYLAVAGGKWEAVYADLDGCREQNQCLYAQAGFEMCEEGKLRWGRVF